jgi:Protein of unknown function (DUF3142)
MRENFITLICALLMGLRLSAAEAPSYWVWHRNDPLRADETAELQQQGVRTLFWHAGEMEMRGREWRWKARPSDVTAFAEPLRVVPVIRLQTDSKRPFEAHAWKKLCGLVRELAHAENGLQIDFDCPDRLLAAYATALGELRRAVPRLSITALAHWSALPEFDALQQGVNEMAPMFYDLDADPTGISANAPPPPLLDPDRVEKALADWSRCRIPWRAGLPTFARLTVFDSTGSSRGQIPKWSWDDSCFHKALHALGPTHLGVTLFRVAGETRIARTPVNDGEIVASRFVDREALARVLASVGNSGAVGITFFRLPDETDVSGLSLETVGDLTSPAQPKVTLRWCGAEQLELTNDSQHDLPPRLAGERNDRDRGYALEIDAPGPIFRDALPGAFWRVTAHVQPDSADARPMPVQLGTRLTFWFSHLRAREKLRSGLVQLAPGANPASLRYRILNCQGASEWSSLNPL